MATKDNLVGAKIDDRLHRALIAKAIDEDIGISDVLREGMKEYIGIEDNDDLRKWEGKFERLKTKYPEKFEKYNST